MNTRAAIVWTVWLAMLAGAVVYVATYGSRVLIQDDLSVVDSRWWGTTGIASRLWNLHNEHRIPLPRVILWTWDALVGDVRASSYTSIALLAAVSAGMIAAARRLRGHTSIADAFFPLVWLHTGNCENLLMGFQVTLMLPTALVCLILTVTLLRAPRLSPRASLACAMALVGLPLCGGPGMLQGPVLALWLAATSWPLLRSGDARERHSGRILLAGVVLTGILGALYMVGFHAPTGNTQNHSSGQILGIAGRVVSLCLGQAAEPWWPWSFVFVAAIVVTATWLAVRAWMRASNTNTRPSPPSQSDASSNLNSSTNVNSSSGTVATARWRAAAIMVGVACTSMLALGIGVARGIGDQTPGFAVRYIGLPAPILCTAYFAWVAFGSRRGAAIVTWTTATVVAVADVGWNLPAGNVYGAWRHDAAEAFVRDVEAGVTCHELVLHHAYLLDAEPTRLSTMFFKMTKLGMYPFDRYPQSARASVDWPMFEYVPRAIEGSIPPAARTIDDHLADIVGGGCGRVFDVPPGKQRVTGTFGALEGAWRRGRYVRARLEVWALDEHSERTQLLARPVEAGTNADDRGALTFAAPFDPARTRSIAVRVESSDPTETHTSWLWLRDVEFD